MLTEAEIIIVLGLGSGISDSLFSRITSLSIYRSGDGLTYSNRKPGRIPRVPWLLLILLFNLNYFGPRWLLFVLSIGTSRY
jgi:hypothetical protein